MPDEEFEFTICHLRLSTDPLDKDPLTSGPSLFIIVPLENVCNTKGDNPVVGPPDPVGISELVADVYDPDTTLHTNNDVPPFRK